MTDDIEIEKIEDCNIITYLANIESYGSDIVNSQIVFNVGDSTPLILSNAGFTYLGEEIKDAGKAYELYMKIFESHSLIKAEKVDL